MINDVQDILELTNSSQSDTILTKESLLGEPKKNVKKSQPTAKKPDGMSRELYNLLVKDKTDLVPLVPTIPAIMGGYKNVKAKLGLRKVRPWRCSPFVNQARKDALKLRHWQKVEDDNNEYPFARFNKVLDIVSPTVEEFKSLDLDDEEWSQDEIDHLFELCLRFDLRWPVIFDRFSKQRSMEDLKEKFYSVSNKMIQLKTPQGEEPKHLHFDAEHERHRKEQLEKLWNRTEEQVEEEEFLMEELQRIEARKKERARKAKDLQKLISAADRSPNNLNALMTSAGGASGAVFFGASGLAAGQAAAQRKKIYKGPTALSISIDSLNVESAAVVKFPEFKSAGAHARSQQMRLPSTLGQKKMKAVEVALQKLELESHPPATEDIVTQFNELRSDIMLLYELKSALSTCEFELETLKHQYQSMTHQELTIPTHLRVTHEDSVESSETSSPFKRRISDALEVPSGPIVAQGVQRKKKMSSMDQIPLAWRKVRKI